MGCGLNKVNGYINIDKFQEAGPELLMDLELTPWEIESDCATEVVFHHSLEHMGADYKVFFSMIQELYRICKHEAIIRINAPHPRHDQFINDPTHVRIITPELMSLFSKRLNRQWSESGAPNSQLGLYLNVDFEFIDWQITVDDKYAELTTQMSVGEILNYARERNNVISEYRIVVKAIKH